MKSITGSTSLIFPYTMWQVCILIYEYEIRWAC